MKTKVILSALALPVLFAACANEDLEFAKQGNELPKDLVELNNPTFTVVSGDSHNVTTRMTTDGKWEASDEVGVGFVNWWNAASASATNRYATGTRHTNPDGTEAWANALTGGDLYANHRLFLDGNAWKFETVVYEGLHYAYYPLDGKHTSVAPLEAVLGQEQEAGKEDEFITSGLFAVSPLYDLENDQAGKAPKVNLTLNTISNRLGLNLELANAATITDPIIIKKVTVKAEKSGPSNNEIFAQAATILGSELPTAIYTEQLKWEALSEGDANKTEAKLAEAIATDAASTAAAFSTNLVSGKALDYTTNVRAATMFTEVKGHTGLTSSAKNYNVNLFTFPVDNANESTRLTVTVETNYGIISIASDDSETGTEAQKQIIKDNNAKLASLIKILNGAGDAPKGTDNQPINFRSYGKYAGTTLKLDMAGATLSDISVANDAEWVEAVKVAGKVAGVTAINVTGDVTASLTNLPANIATINVATGKTLTVSGDITNNLTIAQGDGTSKLKVAAETSLNIKGEMLDETTATFDIALDNFGTVNIDKNSKLTATVTNGVINNHGEVVNNGTLNLLALFTNCKDVKGTAGAEHTCTGVLRNNSVITGSGEVLVNNGTLYQAGTITTVTFGTAGADSKAISIDGADLPSNCATYKEANVESSEQFAKALTAGATTINAKGVIALNTKLPNANIQLNLQNNAEFYIQQNAKNNDAGGVISIAAESGNCLIKSAASVYLDIENLAADPAAVLTIGTEGDTFAKKTAINVQSLSYPRGAKIINYGWVYAAKGSATNTGTWEGLDANKRETSAIDATLIPIDTKLSSSVRP